MAKVRNYEHNLNNLLQKIPKKKVDSTLTEDDILTLIAQQHTEYSIHYRGPETPRIINTFSESK